MAWKATIGGVDQTGNISKVHPVRINKPMNERWSAEFHCKPGYVPAKSAETILYSQDGTTPIFGGVIAYRSSVPLEKGSSDHFTKVQVDSFMAYADLCYWTKQYAAAVDLEDVIADLVTDKLGAYGITYTPVSYGITLDPFSLTDKKASDLLRDIARDYNLIVHFSPAKDLTLDTPGGSAAPYDITDEDAHCQSLEWEDSPELSYNKVILKCGPSSTWYARQQWIADGINNAWVTDLPAIAIPALVEVDDGVTPFLATVGATGAGGQFDWDMATHTLSPGTLPAPAAGTILTLGPDISLGDNFTTQGYLVQGPFTVTDSISETPISEYLAEAPDILTLPAGVARAAAILAEVHQDPTLIKVESVEHGWEPGQTVTIDAPSRELDDDFLITDMSVELTEEDIWIYSFSGTNGRYQGSDLEQLSVELGGAGSSGGGSAVISGTVVSIFRPFLDLGGSRHVATPPSASWVPIVGYKDRTCRAGGDYTFSAQVITENAGTSVQVKLYDLTAEADVAGSETPAETSTTWIKKSAVVTLVLGHDYRVLIAGGNANARVYCGQAEAEL